MEKSNMVNNFMGYVSQLRNTECNQKEKVACFQHIAECIFSSSLASHINYATHCTTAINVLLFFCEDLDSLVRISAEENLNRIIRALEKTRANRVLMDLYGEIKRNGNERSLRICLNLFAYYAPQIKEKHVKWYALRLVPCILMIAKRKEAQLCETLSEFVKCYSKHLLSGLNDGETCKLLEEFLDNICSECPVKRRCSAKNVISLIENSRNRRFLSTYGLNKTFDMLLADQQIHTIIGVLGLVRLLVPLIIRGFDNENMRTDMSSIGKRKKKSSIIQQTDNDLLTAVKISNECGQILEIYDYCLYILNISESSNHTVINAALEVIHVILQTLELSTNGNDVHNCFNDSDKIPVSNSLLKLLLTQHLQRCEYLGRRSALKNQIFHLYNPEVMTNIQPCTPTEKVATFLSNMGNDKECDLTPIKPQTIDDEDVDDDFTTFSEINETDPMFTLTSSNNVDDNKSENIVIASGTKPDTSSMLSVDNKSQLICDMDNESFNSIDFEADLTIGSTTPAQSNSDVTTNAEPVGGNKISSVDAIGSFFTNLNTATESVGKMFWSNKSVGNLSVDSATAEPFSISQTAILENEQNETTMGIKEASITISSTDNSITFPVAIPQVSNETVCDIKDGSNSTPVKEMNIFKQKSTPIVNPFLSERSKETEHSLPVNLRIGGINEQSLILYSTRLVASRFLLTGQTSGLHADTIIRVSIKSLAISVIAQCVRILPIVLELPLEINANEISCFKINLRLLPGNEPESSNQCSWKSDVVTPVKSCNDSSDLSKQISSSKFPISEISNATQLLDIKDDHFGKSTCDILLNQPLSQSADPAMLNRQLGWDSSAAMGSSMPAQYGFGTRFDHLSRSENLSRSPRKEYQLTEAAEDVPPMMPAPQPPVRTKSRAREINFKTPLVTDCHRTTSLKQSAAVGQQQISDILLYYKHIDPILRGGVQHAVGNYILARSEYQQEQRLNLQLLLAVLVKGLQDGIHTVVIQAMNTFDKIFSYILVRYLDTTGKDEKLMTTDHARSNKLGCNSRIVNVNDISEIYLNDFELANHMLKNNPNLIHTPEMLLEKLRLCRFNKYWRVQNKYVEVISNLNYSKMQCYFKNIGAFKPSKETISTSIDAASAYEFLFLDDIIELIGDNDIRVRTYSADCLCRFIINHSQQKAPIIDRTSNLRDFKGSSQKIPTHFSDQRLSINRETYQVNSNLMWDMLYYKIFSGMPIHLQQLFRPNSFLRSQMINAIRTKASVEENITSDNTFASTVQCDMEKEERLLAKVLYSLTNLLMRLADKHAQIGIIYTLKLLLRHFNYIDYQMAWSEFNFLDICMKYLNMNYVTALDLNCQKDLIDVTGTLIAGSIICRSNSKEKVDERQCDQLYPQLEELLAHVMKVVNIYAHIFGKQKPLFFAKVQRGDLFASAKEVLISESVGYFGNDFVYSKLYTMIKSAYDSYKITINQDCGALFTALLKSAINTLSLCIELRVHVEDTSSLETTHTSPKRRNSIPSIPTHSALKLVEETLQYLCKVINYAPIECIQCVQQLLKHLFSQNYASLEKVCYREFFAHFIRLRSFCLIPEVGDDNNRIHSEPTSMERKPTKNIVTDALHYKCLGDLFIASQSCTSYVHAAGRESMLGKHIKLFEPLVVYLLTLFMKSNGIIQASILELLTQLLALNVTYSVLDSKSVIFEQTMLNFELIENDIARNDRLMIPSMIKFLTQLTTKSKLITVPKIISVVNNLLANGVDPTTARLALKTLGYELFFMESTKSEMFPPIPSTSLRESIDIHLPSDTELDTQKEVILGMLDKFIDAIECRQVVSLLLLRERCVKELEMNNAGVMQDQNIDESQDTQTKQKTFQLTLLQAPDALYALVCQALSEDRILIENWRDFVLLNAFYHNNGKSVLAHNKAFLALLQVLLNKNIHFSDLSCATIILDNVILKTEEIYLMNHIKLYLKNQPAKELSEVMLELEMENLQNTKMLDGPSTSAAASDVACSLTSAGIVLNEIKYFAKILCKKLEACLDRLVTEMSFINENCTRYESTTHYCQIAVRFVSTLSEVLCNSRHKDAVQSIFRFVLIESSVLQKFSQLQQIGENDKQNCWNDELASYPCTVELEIELRKLLYSMKLVDVPIICTEKLEKEKEKSVNLNSLNVLLYFFTQSPEYQSKALQSNTILRQQYIPSHTLNILITEHSASLSELCKCDKRYCTLLLQSLLQHAHAIQKFTIQPMLRVVWSLYDRTLRSAEYFEETIDCLKFLDTFCGLHQEDLPLQWKLQRLAKRIITEWILTDKERVASFWATIENTGDIFPHSNVISDILNEEFSTHKLCEMPPSRIIDEKWLFAKLIKFSADSNCEAQQLAKILLEVQSENKVQKIFNNPAFNVTWILQHAIATSFSAMLSAFACFCVQHNPHIHYMQMNPLGRVACSTLFLHLDEFLGDTYKNDQTMISTTRKLRAQTLCLSIITLFEQVEEIEMTSLMYIDAKFIDKFVHEQLLRPEYISTLLRFLDYCCKQIQIFVSPYSRSDESLEYPSGIGTLLRCIELLVKHKLIWDELNLIDHSAIQKNDLQTTSIEGGLSSQKGSELCCSILDTLVLVLTKAMQNTIFLQRYQFLLHVQSKKYDHKISSRGEDKLDSIEQKYSSKAIFVAKFIESKNNKINGCGVCNVPGSLGTVSKGINYYAIVVGGTCNNSANNVDIGGGNCTGVGSEDFGGMDLEVIETKLDTLDAIGTAILRTNQFYAFAVTPMEILQRSDLMLNVQSEQRETDHTASATKSGKLPTIPVDSLSDVDVFQNFVKRLSIFGFTTRQQFEEYFMTFLLLINKDYDENMVDQQEQFQIKSICLEAILELLITYKSFPIVGNKFSYFHHTTRRSRITCDTISLKKLHRVQLLVDRLNVFYHPNLERCLERNDRHSDQRDSVIGTTKFLTNQYDLSFMWQQMEAYNAQSSSSPTEPEHEMIQMSNRREKINNDDDVAMRNYRYFTKQSGIDFKSSSLLIFDMLTQIVESNPLLALPNMVKFCEICDSREQIKWIRDKILKIQETTPMDDTISHQHLIYLACKTQAMLIPTLGELQQLCTLIGNYLKSSHAFIHNATLAGLLCLIECCSKTNTTIGRLSDELSLLRELTVAYINKHGIINESPLQNNETHCKLVWTLNSCLIEWTSKFVPQCNLLSNTIIASSSLLRTTANESVYLCVLHGIERLIIIDAMGNTRNTANGNRGALVAPALFNKIEKLALELVKLENEKFSIPALKLLASCIYVGSEKQLENTELSNGIVQDDPEIIAQQSDKVDILLHCIKSATRPTAWIYGEVMCQIVRDLVPPNEILTKVIKEFLAVNHPHCDVIAMIVYQVFRSAIDSAFLPTLQEWLLCTLDNFVSLPGVKAVWSLNVIFLSASINLHLIKLFPVLLHRGAYGYTNQENPQSQYHCQESELFEVAAQDFNSKLSVEQKQRFRAVFEKHQHQAKEYVRLLQTL